MKITRRFALLLMTCGSMLLGGCSSWLEHGAVALANTAAHNYYRVDTARGSAERVVPTRTQCSNRSDALAACQAYVAANGGSVEITSGSRSMEPLIRGQTYFVAQKRSFEAITKRYLLVYMGRLDASKPTRVKILHRAVLRDRGGWVMSGDNNRWSESWDRVTRETYLGTAVAFFEFPQT